MSLQPAFVLHRRPYKDSSQLLELLTLEHGRVGAVARGVRRPRSRWAGILQPFVPLLVSWSGRGELVTLTGAEPDGAFASLPPSRLMSASYVSELVLRLLQRHDPHPDVYRSYAQTVSALADTSAGEAAPLRVFEKRLLGDIGYALNLTHEARSGTPIEASGWYRYRLEQGPVRVDVADGEMCFSGESLIALAAESLSDPHVLRDARRLLRPALDLYLGERPLRTREVMYATRRASASGP